MNNILNRFAQEAKLRILGAGQIKAGRERVLFLDKRLALSTEAVTVAVVRARIETAFVKRALPVPDGCSA